MADGERSVAEDEPSPVIDWGAASLPYSGELESGDAYVVKPRTSGALIAVIDGLGHGAEAAKAARVATGVIEANAEEIPERLMTLCHESLRKTRGVVMSLASIDSSTGVVRSLGIGNVEAFIVHADRESKPATEAAMLVGGVVGFALPDAKRLRPSTVHISAGDLLILATDGIVPTFLDGVNLEDPPQTIAEHLLAEYATKTDDALVVVARYLG